MQEGEDSSLGLKMKIRSELYYRNRLYQKFGEFEVNCAARIDNLCCAKSLISKYEFKVNCIIYSCCAESLVSKYEFKVNCAFGEFEVNRTMRIDNSCYAKSLVSKWEFEADCAAVNWSDNTDL
ncbi:hypothetical protein C1645_742578 [Glomus cerebriforme]|uniref:Uncharacterized protein n=1 Tax=Glomus cerebriforme TaxID=658196 RepID=A0A397SHE0_9GLOM|nr:hypothetical protein C1645_742578 [Glomus cerebriforme]